MINKTIGMITLTTMDEVWGIPMGTRVICAGANLMHVRCDKRMTLFQRELLHPAAERVCQLGRTPPNVNHVNVQVKNKSVVSKQMNGVS
jgi:hypothetical protein